MIAVIFIYLNNDIDKSKLSVKEVSQLYLINQDINNENLGYKLPDIQLQFGSLSSFIKNRNKPILIFRIKETHCNTCVQHALNILSEVFDDNMENIMIVGSYTLTRNLKIVLNQKLKTDCIIQNETSKIFANKELERYESPYFFILHQNMRISNIFMPDLTFPKLEEQYLKGVKQLLSD